MLEGRPTKRGTGITIVGDYGDLRNLYSIVHHIAESLPQTIGYGQYQLLLNFAYEIRHAYSGDRIVENVTFGDGKITPYYGFHCVWTDILLFMGSLRHNAGFIQTNKQQQGYLYLLEGIIEKALFDYDPVGAKEIQRYIGQSFFLFVSHIFLLYQTLHIRFVIAKSGKRRFRTIPNLFNSYFYSNGYDYKQLISHWEIKAKKLKCKVEDLEIDEFPDIKW